MNFHITHTKSHSYILAIALLSLIFLFTLNTSHAFTSPSGILNYQNLSIDNAQTTATPSPFQQMINLTINSSNSKYINQTGKYSFQNVEFFYSNGTIIPSWLENYTSGHAIWWVKTGSIAASSTLTIYMGFANKTTNLFNNKTTGEAPQLTCPNPSDTASCSTYGEYDDGANVFNFYDNFAGTTINTTLWDTANEGNSISQDNGITLGNTGTTNVHGIIITNKAYYGNILELYGEREGNNGGGGSHNTVELGLTNTYNNGGSIENSYGYRIGQYTYGISYTNSSGSTSLLTSYSIPTSPFLLSLNYTTGSQILDQNYESVSSSTNTALTFTNQPLYISLGYNYGAYYQQSFWYYIRLRAYPPNGVMPSVSFGSVQSTVAITLYLNGVSNANATITYGTESNFTAVISQRTDYVSLYINGTKVASLTQGKAVYLKTLAAGLYKITAATNTSGVSNVTYVIVVFALDTPLR